MCLMADISNYSPQDLATYFAVPQVDVNAFFGRSNFAWSGTALAVTWWKSLNISSSDERDKLQHVISSSRARLEASKKFNEDYTAITEWYHKEMATAAKQGNYEMLDLESDEELQEKLQHWETTIEIVTEWLNRAVE